MQSLFVDEIELISHWPSAYLDIFAYAYERYFVQEEHDAGEAEFLKKLARARGKARPDLRIRESIAGVDWESFGFLLGWHTPDRIEQLIDREWLRGPHNELEAHATAFAKVHGLLECQHPMLVGAGVGGFANWLAEFAKPQSIICSELSLSALRCARELLQNRPESLPPGIVLPREILEVHGADRIVTLRHADEFVAGRCQNLPMRYQVIDSYALQVDRQIDVVASLYVLDVPPYFDSMLLRTIEAMHVGQRLFLVCNATARRDPRLIVESIKRCGLRVDSVALETLPYSLSRHDFAFTQALCPTLLVSAVAREPLQTEKIRCLPTAKLETMERLLRTSVVPAQFTALVEIAPSVSLQKLLQRAFASGHYQGFKAVLAGELGDEKAEALANQLFARCMAMLTNVRGK